jgi:hypothetical protein
MPPSLALRHSDSKRCFLVKTISLGLPTFVPIELFAQADVNRLIVRPMKPWMQLDTAPVANQSNPSLKPQSRDFTFWAGSNPTMRLTHWTRTALKLIVKYQQNPLRAARALAYLHIGMHDSWHYAWHAAPTSLDHVEAKKLAEKAAHETASEILAHFYPNETPGAFSAMLAAMKASLQLDSEEENGTTISAAVTAKLIERSLRDGAGRVWPIKLRPTDFSGIWQASYPLYAVNPTEGFAGSWQPWVSPSAARYKPPIAARPGSPQHAAETEEVLKIFSTLTPSQIQAAQKWHLEAGSVTPAGVWVGIALDELNVHSKVAAQDSETNAPFALQALSTLCAAMHDAFIACWKIKFRDWSERPITAIRRSTDSQFVPLLVTPGFPSYVSGHATISAAAAYVLGLQWSSQSRNFQTMAQEAADSRLWGGIHFKSDNEEGLKLGTAVGRDIALDRGLTASVL